MGYNIHPKTEIKKGQHLSPATEFKKGTQNWLGRHHSEESKKKMSESHKGKKLSEATKVKMKQRIREKSSNWKGGQTKTQKGYIYILCPAHPFANSKGYIPEHRLIVEKHLNRYLTKKEIVHHINGIKSDNRIENLYLFASLNAHTSYHTLFNYNPALVQIILKSNLLISCKEL
uniref:Putative homing endonuclease n=1 Tax=viral metagenome TaxID=1070528 RepID=A0A6H1ZYT9_9ZZZZ